MKLTAIDPGSKRLGVAAFSVDHAGIALLGSDAFNVEGFSAAQLGGFIRGYTAGSAGVVLETPGRWLGAAKANRNLAGLAVLYQHIGMIRYAIELNGIKPDILTDSEVKYEITGRQAAPKHDVHRLLWSVLGYALPQLGKATCADCRKALLPCEHSPDAADAIAIGHVGALRARDALPPPPDPPIKQRVLG